MTACKRKLKATSSLIHSRTALPRRGCAGSSAGCKPATSNRAIPSISEVREIAGNSVGSAHGFLALVYQHAGIHSLAGTRDELKTQLIANNIEEHESHVLVERLLGQGRSHLDITNS